MAEQRWPHRTSSQPRRRMMNSHLGHRSLRETLALNMDFALCRWNNNSNNYYDYFYKPNCLVHHQQEIRNELAVTYFKKQWVV